MRASLKKMLKINDTEEKNLKDLKFKCKYCGHTNSLPSYVDYKICSWCHKKIYNSSKAHFDYKLKKAMKGE